MDTTLVNKKLHASIIEHARLLERFIRITTEAADNHPDAFVRESLHESLEALRDERETYLQRAGARQLEAA